MKIIIVTLNVVISLLVISLNEVEAYVTSNKELPEVSSTQGKIEEPTQTLGKTFLRERKLPSSNSESPDEKDDVPRELITDDGSSEGIPRKIKFTAVPGIGRDGRWFFDWFWGYDRPEDNYPPPPLPLPPGPPIYNRPGPIYPHRPIPDVPLEVCTELHHPITMDVYEECYPLDPY